MTSQGSVPYRDKIGFESSETVLYGEIARPVRQVYCVEVFLGEDVLRCLTFGAFTILGEHPNERTLTSGNIRVAPRLQVRLRNPMLVLVLLIGLSHQSQAYLQIRPR